MSVVRIIGDKDEVVSYLEEKAKKSVYSSAMKTPDNVYKKKTAVSKVERSLSWIYYI
jgi:hypothetical protein